MRLSKSDTFKIALRKIASFEQDGQQLIDWEGCKVIFAAIRAAQHFDRAFRIITQSEAGRKQFTRRFLDHFDSLELYGQAIARLHKEIADDNPSATMTLLLAMKNSEGIKKAFANLDNGREHGIDLAGFAAGLIRSQSISEETMNAYLQFIEGLKIKKIIQSSLSSKKRRPTRPVPKSGGKKLPPKTPRPGKS